MLNSETKTIDGHTYKVTQLPFKKGQKLLVRLYKTLGPAVSEFFAHLPDVKAKELGNLKVTKLLPSIGGAMSVLAERLSEEELEFVTETLAEYSELNKGPEQWVKLKGEMEFHFAGRYGAYLKWLGFALGVNYANFLGETGTLKDLIARVAVKGSPSPAESTGTPTESPQASAIA